MREALTLFAMLDQDRNQGISQWEIGSSANRLGTLDRNRDGRLATSELAGELALEVGYSGARRDESRWLWCEIVPVSGSPDHKRGPPWFQLMDRNQDQRLSWARVPGHEGAVRPARYGWRRGRVGERGVTVKILILAHSPSEPEASVSGIEPASAHRDDQS